MKINIKYSIKKITFLFLYYLLFFTRIKKTNSLLVLTYHRITDEPDLHDPLKVSMANFEKQILFLKKNYNIISGGQLADAIKNNRPFPDKACLITFDDGWRDNYTHAFPILRKYQIPAIIFISTDYIGTNKVFWHEKLCNILAKVQANPEKVSNAKDGLPVSVAERVSNIIKIPHYQRRPEINDLIEYLKKYTPKEINNFIKKLEALFDVVEEISQPVMLSWEQVKEMSQNNICFGSHTKSHAILTQISDDEIEEELRDSKYIIANKIGKPVFFLSYPNGNYDKNIVKIAKKSDYLAGFTCISGINYSYKSLLELKRKHVREDITLGLNERFSEIFFKIEISGTRDYLKSMLKNIV